MNDYSYKHICVVCYLKLYFYCLGCCAMSNLNIFIRFQKTEQSSKILVLNMEMLLEFQNKTNLEIIGLKIMYFGFALNFSEIAL